MDNVESMVSEWFKANIPEDATIVKDIYGATIKVETSFYAGTVGCNPGWCDRMSHKIKTIRFVQYKKDNNPIISEWIWEEKGKLCKGYYNPNKKHIFIGRHTCSVEIV